MLQTPPGSTDIIRVRLLTRTSRARTIATLAISGALLSAAPLVTQPAHAETSGQAAATVQALLVKVHRLQAQVLAAEQRYNAVFTSVSDSVNIAIQDDSTSETVSQAAQSAQAAVSQRVQAIYESGGSLAAFATMLSSGDLNELSERNEMVSRVVSAQAAEADRVATLAKTATLTAAKAEKRAHLKIGTERDVAAAAARWRGCSPSSRHCSAGRQAPRERPQGGSQRSPPSSASFGSITTAQHRRAAHPAAVRGVPRAVQAAAADLPRPVLDGARRDRSGRERPRPQHVDLVGRRRWGRCSSSRPPSRRTPSTATTTATTNIMDPADAIYTAAHYLCANGAGRGPSALGGAILHYNHAGWYVDMVLKLAGMYATWKS